MTPYDLLVKAEGDFAELVDSLAPADLDRPTPCAGWDVRALLSHTLAGIEMFAAATDGGVDVRGKDMFTGADLVGDDPAGVTKQVLARSQAAWAGADPAAGVVTGLGPMPAGQALAISTFATIVHGWDLAVATGRPVRELAPDLHAHAHAVAVQIAPGLRGDLFRPEQPVPAGATPTQQLMAYLGRVPVGPAA